MKPYNRSLMMTAFRNATGVLLALVLASTLFSPLVFAEEATLDVGYLPVLSQLPIIVTYEKERLNLEKTHLGIYLYNSYTSMEAAMRVGSIDIASLPATIALSMAAEGYDVLIIGSCARGGSRVMARKAGDLNSLKGGMIGVPGLDSNETLQLKRMMDGIGLRFGRDYHPIDVPLSSVLSNMKTAKLDAFFLPEPFGILVEKEKIGAPVSGQKEKTAGVHYSFLVIRKKTLAAKRESVEAWLKRLVAACRFIEADIRSSGGVQVSIIQEPWLHLPREIVAEGLSKRTGDMAFGGFVVDASLISGYANLAGTLNLLNKSVIVKDIIHMDLMERANQ